MMNHKLLLINDLAGYGKSGIVVDDPGTFAYEI